MDTLSLIGRSKNLFEEDLSQIEQKLSSIVKQARFLVLGGGGSIGRAVVKEIFQRSPLKVHVVDLSENNLAELVRDIRSSFGHISGDFKTFALDIGSPEYDAFFDSDGKFDYVLNLSALKHVRSEKDPYTLMRMIGVNIFNVKKTLDQACAKGVRKYFSVSTDKAANPENLMGASKRVMEMFLLSHKMDIKVSMARFANVAFSDGSLLFSFSQRLLKNQPLVAPNDVQRYFLTEEEAGQLCLLSCLFGDDKEIFFPKLDARLHLLKFSQIAVNFLKKQNLEPFFCQSEGEARSFFKQERERSSWPCFFEPSNTTGEKMVEEFYTEGELVDLKRYSTVAIVKPELEHDIKSLVKFENNLKLMLRNKQWTKHDILNEFNALLPNLSHVERMKDLDSKM